METSLFQGQLQNSNRILYTPSSFAKTYLIYLQEIGQLHACDPHTSRRQSLSSYLFFMVEKGTGVLEYDGKIYPLSSGDCVFIDCRKTYSHRTSEDLWTLRWAHFYGSNLSGIYEKYVERGGLPYFRPTNFSLYKTLLEEIHSLAKSGIYIRDMKIYEKLTSLLTLLMEESWHPTDNIHTTSSKRNLQDIRDYLDLHYQEKITLDDLADFFYINKFYMSRIFKEQFGLTINHYLLQVRITHAKQLLRFSDLPIEKIAHECGMSDSNYFTRIFKKVEGMAPGEFRRHWTR